MFGIETDIFVKVLTTRTVDPSSSCEIQKAQLEDPTIRPILEKKLNSADRLSWQEIAAESLATKRYWALWDFLHLKDGVQTESGSAKNEVTGLAPAEMLFGRTLQLPCDIIFGRPSETPSLQDENLKNLEARLESVHAFPRERIKLANERMKTPYDSREADHHFKKGDLVLMYTGEIN
ncbi:hypothetical protein AVEN_216686-1 [Araneus ventricosus]|uniref:Uncharacterized protein n=1 Tax=Araneus ventricosus TaxID=182803 RepID=A0A4Y2DXD9_ARAVE|nr:hypothetical protein AVEN_216686-1 [Araneus ventricosus]